MQKSIEKSHFDHLPHATNIYGKFQKFGLEDDGFNDVERLQCALNFVMPSDAAESFASRLIEHFGSLKEVLDAKTDKVLEVDERFKDHASYLNFLKAFAVHYTFLNIRRGDLLSSPKMVYDYFITLLSGEPVEKFCMLTLNSGNRLIKSIVLATGIVNKAMIHPRKVVEQALDSNAVAVILAHNHPGGNTKVSEADISTTKCIRDSLKAIDITLHDHIIVAGNRYLSFREEGFL
jgi:DNA repair protein RadC